MLIIWRRPLLPSQTAIRKSRLSSVTCLVRLSSPESRVVSVITKSNLMNFRTIISGGCEGAIRIWRIDLSNPAKPVVSLEETMKEHKCKVTTITVICAQDSLITLSICSLAKTTENVRRHRRMELASCGTLQLTKEARWLWQTLFSRYRTLPMSGLGNMCWTLLMLQTN